MTPTVRLTWLDGADTTLPLPQYETAGAAGADLRANFPPEQRDSGINLDPLHRALIPTGLSLELPEGYELQVRPRSGLALKQGLTVLNTPGTVDADYRGPLGVILINLSQAAVHIAHGDRIAQAVIAPVARATFTLTNTLSATDRGSGGFGSTGVG